MSVTRLIRQALGGDLLRLDAETYVDNELSPAACDVRLQLQNNGNVLVDDSASEGSVRYAWLIPGVNAGLYEVEVVLTAGTFTTGTSGAGTWQSLGTTREWTILQSTIGTKTTTATWSIRRIGTTAVLRSASITMQATVDA